MSIHTPMPPLGPYGAAPAPAFPHRPRRRRWPLIIAGAIGSTVLLGIILILGLGLLVGLLADSPPSPTGVAANRPGPEALPSLPKDIDGYTLMGVEYLGHGGDPQMQTNVNAIMATYARGGSRTTSDGFTVLAATGSMGRNELTRQVPDDSKACVSRPDRKKALCAFFSHTKSLQVEQSGTTSTETVEKALDRVLPLF